MSSRKINLTDYPMAHPPALEWLQANGLDTSWLLYNQEVLIADGKLTAVRFIPSDAGSTRKIKVVGDEPVTETVTVPLISAPENHGL